MQQNEKEKQLENGSLSGLNTWNKYNWLMIEFLLKLIEKWNEIRTKRSSNNYSISCVFLIPMPSMIKTEICLIIQFGWELLQFYFSFFFCFYFFSSSNEIKCKKLKERKGKTWNVKKKKHKKSFY